MLKYLKKANKLFGKRAFGVYAKDTSPLDKAKVKVFLNKRLLLLEITL